MRWLLLSYSVPAQPSALRVATWRALKQAGAVLLGPGLYALPEESKHEALLADLSARIVAGGGTAITLSAAAMTEDDEHAIAARFAGARDEEYRQVIKSARKFHAHVEQEERDRDFRFAEVESLDEELNKVRRQLSLVYERDVLAPDSRLRPEAQQALTEAEQRLQQYIDSAYQEDIASDHHRST